MEQPTESSQPGKKRSSEATENDDITFEVFKLYEEGKPFVLPDRNQGIIDLLDKKIEIDPGDADELHKRGVMLSIFCGLQEALAFPYNCF